MKHLRFIRNDGPYSPGDVAGFDPAVAEIYIQRHAAELAFPLEGKPANHGGPVPDVVATEIGEPGVPKARGRK